MNTAVGITQSWFSAVLGNRIAHDVRSDSFQHLQYLSLRFFDKRQMGSVISRVNQDTGQLQRFLVWGAQDLRDNLLLIVGIGTMLFVHQLGLALFVFVPAPLVVIRHPAFLAAHSLFHAPFLPSLGTHQCACINETLNGMRVVKAFAQEPREERSFSRAEFGTGRCRHPRGMDLG